MHREIYLHDFFFRCAIEVTVSQTFVYKCTAAHAGAFVCAIVGIKSLSISNVRNRSNNEMKTSHNKNKYTQYWLHQQFGSALLPLRKIVDIICAAVERAEIHIQPSTKWLWE